MQVSSVGYMEVDGAKICYDFLPGDGPTILFLPALNQTRHGAKSNALKTWCRRQVFRACCLCLLYFIRSLLPFSSFILLLSLSLSACVRGSKFV
jgi:hypothetical protein